MKTRTIRSYSLYSIAFMLVGLIVCGCKKGAEIIVQPESQLTEEEIKVILENAEKVEKDVTVFYESATSVEDMAQHLDEIKAMANVEDAWQDNDISVSVKIKDGGIISWCFFPMDEEEDVEEETEIPSQNKAAAFEGITRAEDIALCKEKTVCIANPNSNDLSRTRNDYFLSIKEKFEREGYTVKQVDGEDVTLGFLCKELPKYGVSILRTHGSYSRGKNTGEYKHWLLTGTQFDQKDINNAEISIIEKFYDSKEYKEYFPLGVYSYFEAWGKDSIRSSHVKELWDFGGQKIKLDVSYLSVSETYLEKKMSSFPSNSLMFVTACQSMYENESLANVFKKKNLGCYFGYDDTVLSMTAYQGMLGVFDAMLDDQLTASEAYNKVPDKGRVSIYDNEEGRLVIAYLKLCPKGSNICLVEPDPEPSTNLCPDKNHPHAIDLGLRSGLKWACCNVGANKPEDYGGYYAWGETSEKSFYGFNTYQHATTNDNGYVYCMYDGVKYYPVHIGDNISGTSYDAATVNWGNSWRMPTRQEWGALTSLVSGCNIKNTTYNGVNGRMCTGPNGNSIFLPLPGYKWHDELIDQNLDGRYWSSTCTTTNTFDGINEWEAYYEWFYESGAHWRDDFGKHDNDYRYYGRSIRPISK